MIELSLKRLHLHKSNVDRYRRLLTTRLSDLERAYVERRLDEEQASLQALLQETFPQRLSARLPRMVGQTTNLEMDALLHPSGAYDHPLDVIDDCDLTSYEKRAILSSWAADVCASPGAGRSDEAPHVSFDDILDALHLLESEPPPAPDAGERRGHSGEQSSGLTFR